MNNQITLAWLLTWSDVFGALALAGIYYLGWKHGQRKGRVDLKREQLEDRLQEMLDEK